MGPSSPSKTHLDERRIQKLEDAPGRGGGCASVGAVLRQDSCDPIVEPDNLRGDRSRPPHRLVALSLRAYQSQIEDDETENQRDGSGGDCLR